MRLSLSLVTLFLAGVLLSSAADVEEVRVVNTGKGPLEESSVRAFISMKVGDEFSRSAVSQDVRNLQKSGRFSFVEAVVDRLAEGIAVSYKVRSKPRIRGLKIEGADYLGNRRVRKTLELGIGDLVDDATVAVKAQAVTALYQKKHFPFVELLWEIDEDEELGLADVTLIVKEGSRVRVRRILFEGNQEISSRKLRRLMKQGRTHLLSWLTGSGAYKPDVLATDVAMLREFYLSKGHLDVRIGEPQIRKVSRRRIDIVLAVEEGIAYRVGDVTVEGVSLFGQDQVARGIKLRTDDVASMAAIRAAASSVRDYYGRRGYIETQVRPSLNARPDIGIANITFDIKEGNLAYIRDVNIRGNTRTKDKVIRRELAVAPGDIFNEVRVRTSERRLWNLGYFSFVDSMAEPTLEPDYYDLSLEVQEQKTGQFVIGAGFSSVDDVVGFVELSQGNFDLFGWPGFTGGGQKLKLRSQFGSERTDFEVSFVEPWLFDRKLALGVDFFQHDRKFLSDDYDQKNIGGSVSLGKALGPSYRLTLKYSLEEIDVYDVSEDASEIIQEEEGARTKSAMSLSLLHDSRNSVFVASRGNRTTLTGTLAGGPLGAETDLYEVEARSSQYFPLWFGHVLNLKGWAAVVEEYGDSDRVPIFDRLFLGGARTVRGFRYRDIGPRDSDGEPIGGRSAAYGTAEYTIPLGKNMRFASFYDCGMVWEDAYTFESDLNSSWGIGLRFDIPGFPLRLDYAWPIETEEYIVIDESTILPDGTGAIEREKTNDQPSGRFSFLIGYSF